MTFLYCCGFRKVRTCSCLFLLLFSDSKDYVTHVFICCALQTVRNMQLINMCCDFETVKSIQLMFIYVLVLRH